MKKIKPGSIVQYTILTIWAIVNLFPLYWMVTFSLKENSEIFGDNIIGLPKQWLWSNYEAAMTTGHMGRYFLNSFIVTGLTILFTVVFALMLLMPLADWNGRDGKWLTAFLCWD